MQISGELRRLQMVKAELGNQERGLGSLVVAGVEAMDDGAILGPTGGKCLVLSTDFVRASGFLLYQQGLLGYFDLGYYLITANASDLAAMGAAPVAAMTVLRYSDTMSDEQFVDAIKGMKAAAEQCGLEIIGGDIGGHSKDVFAATVIGSVDPGRELRRRGASVGDLLCVTGTIGLPITALSYFMKARSRKYTLPLEDEALLLDSWRRPHARIAEGQILSGSGIVTACQDISDGLKATIDQLADASGVCFQVEAARLPIHRTTTEVANALDTDPIGLAMSASVDFELLFTVKQSGWEQLSGALGAVGCPVVVIGRAIEASGNVLVGPDGRAMKLPGIAWDQQPGDYLTEIIHRGELP